MTDKKDQLFIEAVERVIKALQKESEMLSLIRQEADTVLDSSTLSFVRRETLVTVPLITLISVTIIVSPIYLN